MKITYANTIKMKDIANDIVILSNEYNNKITNFFNKITTFPYDTETWGGGKAELYASLVSEDKQQYIDFAEDIKNFGIKIFNAAESIEKCVKTSNSGGSYKG